MKEFELSLADREKSLGESVGLCKEDGLTLPVSRAKVPIKSEAVGMVRGPKSNTTEFSTSSPGRSAPWTLIEMST